MHKPKGRRLRLEIEQVEQPRSTATGMDDQLGPRTDSGRWSGGANGRLDLIPNMPERCRITLQVRVLEMAMCMLREFDGFTFTSDELG